MATKKTEQTTKTKTQTKKGTTATEAKAPGVTGIFKLERNEGALIAGIGYQAAQADLINSYPASSLEDSLSKGEVLFTETAYYSTDTAALEELQASQNNGEVLENPALETATESPAETEAPEAESVNSDDNAQDAEVLGETVNESPVTALAKTDDVIIGLPEEPNTTGETLTPEEKAELIERETAVVNAADTYFKAGFVIGENLEAIRTKRLYRETHPDWKQYVLERFGYTREYAYQLEAAAAVFDAVTHGLTDDEKRIPNISTMLIMDRQAKLLAKEVPGMDTREATNFMRGVEREAWKLLVDIAPKNETSGKPVISQQLMVNLFDNLKDFMKTGKVTIDGKDIPIKDAHKLGISGAALAAETLTQTSEQIRAAGAIVASATEKRQVDKNASNYKKVGEDIAKKMQEIVDKPDKTVSKIKIKCSEHGDVTVTGIPNARIVYSCGCVFGMIEGVDGLVCLEVGGVEVVYKDETETPTDLKAKKKPEIYAFTKEGGKEIRVVKFADAINFVKRNPLDKDKETATKEHIEAELLNGKLLESKTAYYSSKKDKVEKAVERLREKAKKAAEKEIAKLQETVEKLDEPVTVAESGDEQSDAAGA